MFLDQGNINKIKREINKDKFSEIQSAKPGFASTGDRDCLKRNGKVQSPGPGHYIDINSTHFIANQNIQKYNSERGIGNKPHTANSTHFGSKSMRFNGGFFQTKDGPGPGQYVNEKSTEDSEPKGILTKAQINNRGKGGCVFKSTTNRFVENEPTHPNVRILDKKPDGTNDLIIYNIKQQINKTEEAKYKGMYNPVKRVGFTATVSIILTTKVLNYKYIPFQISKTAIE